MRREDFYYELPQDLIASYPSEKRGDSRLLSLDRQTGQLVDKLFSDLPDYLVAGDVMVFNDTRVIPARLFAHKESGGKVEIMVERLLDNKTMLTQLRYSKKPKPFSKLVLDDGTTMVVHGEQNGMFNLGLSNDEQILDVINRLGHVPLPPYINRDDQALDQERYQTVYAKIPGAVAAPTAGLHFTPELLQKITARGVHIVYVTLHVGAGTFQPVRTEQIEDHLMHTEYLEVTAHSCDVINQARINGKRIIAVGTTSVRCLETANQGGTLKPYKGETGIFIYPGYTFKMVDVLITNFHLPESTLLMLVAAFAGRMEILAAYRHAIDQQYRFYSYGDAMLIM